jgi:demethylmenaquinone methyltransferase/2-methoxy-6-polyprenyl-1,4-benzoquinol methylase
MEIEVDRVSSNAAEFDAETDDVFSRIASRYDRLCDIFSLLAHRYWKRSMAGRISRDPGAVVLDVASGTGDIALRVASRQMGRPKRIIASDICPEMLAIARAKAVARQLSLEFEHLDAHRLTEVADASIDAYAISFGLKICDRRLVLGEALRVLRPGGSMFCLEASRIPLNFINAAYLRYMDWCLPLIARIATRGDRGAYDYLLRGIHEFPGAVDLASEFEEAGFVDVTYTYLTFGIVALHIARKPGPSELGR